MNFNKKLLTIAITSSLVACGGGGGGSPATSSGTVSGSVVKGIVVGGKVTAKSADGLTEYGTATTDANGDYSITLDPSYTGGPIRIEIEGADGATMKCDVVGGCDHDNDGDATTANIAFGQTFPLTSKFKLKAVVADATGTVDTHVTALTDMAAKLAERNSGDGMPLNAEAISGANSQVAQLFGLSSGDALTQSKPIDITNPAVIATASVEQLRNALYSAAILGAVLKTTRTSDDIGDALEAFSDAFKDDSGQLVANDGTDDTKTSLKDILTEADALLKEDTVSGAIASKDTEIQSKITADKTEAETKPENELTDSQPSPTAASEDIQQTLAMIADLRNLAYALGARTNSSHISESDKTDMDTLILNGDAFANELSTAGDVTDQATQYLVKALGMAASAMAQAGAQYASAIENDDTPPATVTVDGVQVTITVPDSTKPLEVVLSVSQTGLNVDAGYSDTDGINLVDLALSFSLALTGVQDTIDSLALTSGTDSNGNPTLAENGGGTLSLTATTAGTVTGPTSKLSILNSEAKPSGITVDVQQLAVTDLRTEQALVTVDGSSADWNTSGMPWWNWSDSVTDATGDTSGGAGTDITEFLYRSSDLQLAFGLRMIDDPVFPHTDPAVHPHSRYDVGMVLYKDDNCSDELGSESGEPWFVSARNVTQGGSTFGQVRTFDINDVEVGTGISITAPSTGDLIEILMPQSALPTGANSVRAHGRVRWYDADGTRGNLDSTNSVCITLRNGNSYVEDSFAGTVGIQPSSIGLNLNAKIEQLGVETPAMFEGGFAVSLTGLDADATDSGERSLTENSGSSPTFTESDTYSSSGTLTFSALNLSLSGTFSRGSDSFDAFFDATVGGSGFTATEDETDNWSTTYDADGNWLSNNGSGFTSTTTTTGFVTLDAMLKFTAVIAGVSNSPVVVQLDLNRDTETTGSAGLRITQGSAGKYLEVTAQLAKGADSTRPDEIGATSASFTNQDGISIDLLDAESTLTGKITKGSGDSLKQLGTVTEESGTAIFRLNNGSTNRIESL